MPLLELWLEELEFELELLVELFEFELKLAPLLGLWLDELGLELDLEFFAELLANEGMSFSFILGRIRVPLAFSGQVPTVPNLAAGLGARSSNSTMASIRILGLAAPATSISSFPKGRHGAKTERKDTLGVVFIGFIGVSHGLCRASNHASACWAFLLSSSCLAQYFTSHS